MNLSGARRTGQYAIVTALLSTGACATQGTHAVQQMATRTTPIVQKAVAETVRVSHAERNLAIAEASGHYSKAMIALARRDTTNVDEAAQILVDGVNAYEASEKAAKRTCARLTKETCQGQAPEECVATRLCVLESTSTFSAFYNDVRDRLLRILAR